MVEQQSARKIEQTRTTRRARGSLSEGEILAGARELIERDGLAQLSMPALARHLGSGVTSIYWYFRSKDDLLTALAESVTSEMYARLPPVGDRGWDVELEQYFVSFREGIKRSPIHLELFEHRAYFLMSRASVAKEMLRRVDDMLGVLVREGFSLQEAARVYTAFSAYTRGFVLLERGLLAEEAGSDVGDQIDRYVQGLDSKAYPILTQLASFNRAMALDDAEFKFGLRLQLAGVRARLEEENRS